MKYNIFRKEKPVLRGVCIAMVVYGEEFRYTIGVHDDIHRVENKEGEFVVIYTKAYHKKEVADWVIRNIELLYPSLNLGESAFYSPRVIEMIIEELDRPRLGHFLPSTVLELQPKEFEDYDICMLYNDMPYLVDSSPDKVKLTYKRFLGIGDIYTALEDSNIGITGCLETDYEKYKVLTGIKD